MTDNETNSSPTGMYMSEKMDEEPRFQWCESTTWFARIAVALSFVALVFHVIAMATPYWIMASIKDEEVAHAGLWIECQIANQYTTRASWVCLSFAAAHHLEKLPPFLKCTQGLAILGLILAVGSSFILSLFALLPKLAGRKIASIIAVVTAVLAGTVVIIGAIVFAAEYPTPQDILQRHSWYFGYGFGFEFVFGLLCYGVAALLLVDMRRSMIIQSFRFF